MTYTRFSFTVDYIQADMHPAVIADAVCACYDRWLCITVSACYDRWLCFTVSACYDRWLCFTVCAC